MVLEYVSYRPHAVVEGATTFDTKGLGHGDLDTRHIAAVPQRLEERVGKAEDEEVLNRLLAEVVVDPEDRLLGEGLMEQPVQLLSRCEVPSEGLLHDESTASGEPRRRQTSDDVAEEQGRDGEVEKWVVEPFQSPGQGVERGGLAIVPGDVAEL